MLTLRHNLLDCFQNGSSTQESIARSCQGIVFINTPYFPESNELFLLSMAAKILPNSVSRSFSGDALLKELKVVNEDFITKFTRMPSTFYIVSQYNFRIVSFTKKDSKSSCVINPQAPDPSHAFFPPEIKRQGRDEYLTVIESKRSWITSLHKDHPTFIAIMTHIQGWTRMENLPMLQTTIPSPGEQVTGGVNLLSVGSYDVTLLTSGC